MNDARVLLDDIEQANGRYQTLPSYGPLRVLKQETVSSPGIELMVLRVRVR